MTTYITLDTALRTLETAYLFSVVLLIAFSCLGWAVLETLEADKPSSKPKWFFSKLKIHNS